MSASPVFFTTPICALAQVTVANTGMDGTGTLVDVVTGAAGGTKIDQLRTKATVTTTAGMVRLFLYDGTSVTELFEEIPVAAVTISATVEGDETVISYDNLVIPENYVLKAATHNAEAINVIAHGANA